MNIKKRSRILKAIRDFFHNNDFIEVDTPVRIPAPALEDYIDAIPADKTYGEKMYLRTSPELHLKRFIASEAKAGRLPCNVFQIGPCFRQGEIGSRHREEFTMLEWYRTDADYLTILEDTKNLILNCAKTLDMDLISFQGKSSKIFQEWEILTVSEAFLKYADCTVEQAIADDKYEEILTEKIEPFLGQNTPTVLIDYPASQAALARLKPENPSVAERWELYIAGIELANCYTELTDPDEQRLRFEATAQLRANDGREVYPIDEDFLQSMQFLPPTGGIALGVDRLCMIFLDTLDIAEARAF